MSKYEVTDIPVFTEGQNERLNYLQAKEDGMSTLDDRAELLKLQFLEAAYQNKVSDTAKAVKLYERAMSL